MRTREAMKTDGVEEVSGTGSRGGSSWWMALVFAGGTLLAGMLAALASFALIPGAVGFAEGLKPPPITPPDWAFWAVWILIYPTLGFATWLVWRRRRVADVRGALALFVLLLVGNFMFLPISNLTGGEPAVLTLMDANGLVYAYVLTWLYSRYDKASAWWLAPLLIWMPVTTFLKAWLWTLNV